MNVTTKSRPKAATPVVPPTLALPSGVLPGSPEATVDVLFAVWTGNEAVIEEYRRNSEPRIKARQLQSMAAQAGKEVKQAEADWHAI